MAGESTVWILPLRADIEMDAGQLKIVFREFRKLIVAQIRAIAERNESSVGQVVGAQVSGLEVSRKAQVGAVENPDRAFLDDRHDVFFRSFAG